MPINCVNTYTIKQIKVKMLQEHENDKKMAQGRKYKLEYAKTLQK